MSKLLCTDVLAIRCLKDFILVGIGYTLHVFNKDTYKLMKTISCLYPHNIHGIIDGPADKLAVFGANSIHVYTLNVENRGFILDSCSKISELRDWIIAVKWFSTEGNDYLSVLFAHNYVDIYDISCGLQKSIGCIEKCILYGGSISVHDKGKLTILSGTVFREILIWQVDYHATELKDIPILHRLTGHNGVIFSVIYDPCKQLICSTSDDRTVRIWQVNFSNAIEKCSMDWKNAEVKLVRTAFGHSARVWRSIIQDDLLITIGEDSLICTWSLTGQLLNKVYAHHGAAIWSIEIDNDRNSILTGGADGAVHLWSLNNEYTQKTIILPDLDIRNTLKSVCYLKSGTLFIFNNAGQVLVYDKDTDHPRETLLLEKYGSYCIVQVSECRSYIAIASRDGYVSVYEEIDQKNGKKLERIFEEQILKGQIFSLYWLSKDSMIVCGENGMLKTFCFTDKGQIKVKSMYSLPPARERWLTAAVVYDELLVCGDRAGHVHVYRANLSTPTQTDTESSNSGAEPIQTFYKVHGRIGVQSFDILNGKLMSAGRDGTVKFYKVKQQEHKNELYDLHREKMPMDWIGKSLKINEDVLILGFKEAEFIIYSMFHHRILGRIACGGGHRSWDCITLNDSIKFAFIRNKQVFEYDYSLHPIKRPVLLGGFHTKEVYCVRLMERFGHHNIFVSGGEDSTLRLTCVTNHPENGKCTYRTLGILDGHISGIKSIAITELNNDCSEKKYLAFSAGGRAQIKVWEINANWNNSTAEPVDISCSDVASHLLYGLDKYRRKPWQDKEESYVMEPETRYMDVSIYRTVETLPYVFLFTACADGYLRIFLYSTDTRTIQLRACTKYCNRCILRVHTLEYEGRIIVLTMSTDGVLRFFDFTRSIKTILDEVDLVKDRDCCVIEEAPLVELSLHQSGINCFDISQINKGQYILATGGDDNLLSLILFQVILNTEGTCNKVSIELQSKWNTSSAHSTQITGVQLNENKCVYSVGMDQRVILHKFELQNNVLSMKLIYETLTSIADVQGLVQWTAVEEEDPFACIYGKGFEVLSLKDK